MGAQRLPGKSAQGTGTSAPSWLWWVSFFHCITGRLNKWLLTLNWIERGKKKTWCVSKTVPNEYGGDYRKESKFALEHLIQKGCRGIAVTIGGKIPLAGLKQGKLFLGFVEREQRDFQGEEVFPHWRIEIKRRRKYCAGTRKIGERRALYLSV